MACEVIGIVGPFKEFNRLTGLCEQELTSGFGCPAPRKVDGYEPLC